MDIFLLIGDILHIVSLVLIVMRIRQSKNVYGLSYKTQQMYLIVFITRYSNMIIFNHHFEIYFIVSRSLLLGINAILIYLIRLKQPYFKTYNQQQDSFARQYNYLLALVITIIFPQHNSLYGYLWTFSIWLEATAIIPQIHMLRNYGQISNISIQFILMLGLYRIFYILHWYTLYRSRMFNWQKAKIHSSMAGIIQSILCVCFIYLYLRRKKQQHFMHLPS